ncbi:MAG: lytic transglycosylase domain-containing protein [Pseudomonadota bacterium]
MKLTRLHTTLLLCIGLIASAQSGLTKAQVYRYVDENGIIVLTNITPDKTRYDVENVGCYGTCVKGVDWHSTPLKREPYRDEILAAAEIYDVDAALVRAIMHAESWFNHEAVSHAGAEGLMQLMPATQTRFGVEDAFEPLENITGGVAYLAELLETFDNDWELAAAAYNAGEGAVKRHDGIPPFEETREYVRRLRILYPRYRS